MDEKPVWHVGCAEEPEPDTVERLFCLTQINGRALSKPFINSELSFLRN